MECRIRQYDGNEKPLCSVCVKDRGYEDLLKFEEKAKKSGLSNKTYAERDKLYAMEKKDDDGDDDDDDDDSDDDDDER